MADLEHLRARARIIQELRAFFIERGYLEVDTPALAPALIPEPTIGSFATRFENPFLPAADFYLVPSPELWMKRLLARGSGNIFQISHCFRNAEQLGTIHNPEFTMLEWYTLEDGYMESAGLTGELLARLQAISSQGLLPQGATSRPAAELLGRPLRRLSMAEAVQGATGIDLERFATPEELREAAGAAGVPVEGHTTWEETFNALFLQLVEPALPTDRPLVLYNYPSAIPTLAKAVPGTPWSERWELYIAGIEIANCFTEERDPDRVRAFFALTSAEVRDRKVDLDFPRIFEEGFPKCSGVALGVDRLVMLLTGARSLGGVINFPFSDILATH